MAITAEQLNIILSARDKEFTKAMTANQKRVERFAKTSQKNLSKVSKSYNQLGTVARKVAPILAAAFGVRAAQNATALATEIKNLSTLAGVSTTELQKMAAASRTVGIDQQKMADILKDVNDRVGDFLATGGGPMKDFFEKVAPLVGVTAENFKNLSSKDALQLFVKTLQDAGASQQDFTFFLEAMASDASALTPLLINNAEAFNRLGDEAERSGRIMSQDAIDGAQELNEELKKAGDQIRTRFTEALMRSNDEIIVLANFVEQYAIPAFESITWSASKAAEMVDFLAKSYKTLTSQDGGHKDLIQEDMTDLEGKISNLRSDRERLNKRLSDILTKDGQQVSFDDLRSIEKAAVIGLTKKINSISATLETSNYALQRMREDLNSGSNESKDGGDPNKLSLTINEDNLNLGDGIDFLDTDSVDDQADALENLKSQFSALLTTLDPVADASMTYAQRVELINEAVAKNVTTQEQANFMLGQARLEMARTQDEMTGLANITDTLADGFENVFMAALEGGESMKDAVRSMAAAVIKELYRVLVVQNMVNAAMGSLGFSPTASGSFTRGNAHGGTVQAGVPTTVGEHGREVFVPQTAGRILSVPQAKAAAGGGDSVVVNQSINVSTGVQQTVRAEVLGLMPQIAEASKAAVLDARRRGGAFAGAF